MKRFPLLPQLALVFAVIYACSDSTAPANSNAMLSPTGPLLGFLGDPPPPPVDVGMTISVNSPGRAVFTGVFFSNGKISDDGSSSESTFDGTAWLRLNNNNKQPTSAGQTSANTRFMVKDNNPPTGMGTLTFVEGDVSVTYTIVSVEEFTLFNNSDCKVNFQPCVHIDFTAQVVGGEPCDLNNKLEDPNCHHGNLTAFNVQGCVFVPSSEGHFDCPDSGL